MKVLFVGIFSNPWSTHVQMKREMERQGHTVISFDYRVAAKHYAKSSPVLSYLRLATRLVSICRPLFSSPWVDKLYYRLGGHRQMGLDLLHEIETQAYDLVFFAKSEYVDYTIVSACDGYTRTWYYFVDPMNTALRTRAAHYAVRCDWSSATHSDVNNWFSSEGANSTWLTQGADTSIFRKYDIPKDRDVVFVGMHTPKRQRFLDFLRSNRVQVSSYGPGSGNGSVYLEDLVGLYNRSRIILNLNRSKVGFSIRVFQAMATGSFMLSEYATDLERIFQRREHLDWFESPEEGLKLIKCYLERETERERIAKRGREYVLEHYVWENIIRTIFDGIAAG